MTALAPTTTAALDLWASLVLESGRRYGEVATAEQWTDARAVLDPDGPPYNYLTRARGWDKTGGLASLSLSAMLTELSAGSRLYGIAADRDQGRLLVDALAGFVHRTPGIASSVDVASYKATAANGSVLEVLAADDASAWGLRPAWLIVDELAQWPSTPGARRLWEAVTSAMAKVPGARLVVLTSAGDPAHWSYRVLEHAYADALWRVHEIDGPPPWADPARLDEQRRRLPESSYARLFLNRWTAAEDRLTNLADLRACVTLDGPQEPKSGRRYVVGVDLGLKSDRTVAALCHPERAVNGATVHLDRMAVWQGSPSKPVDLNAVEAWLDEAAHRYGAAVVADPWQSVGMCQRLRARGVRVTEFAFSSQSVGRLATALHTAVRDHHLALPDDPELLDELSNVRLREASPGVLRMDHDPGRHDDRAIALALAVHNLLDRPGSDWSHLFYARRCPTCEATVSESTVECPECLTPLEPMASTPLSDNPWAHTYGVSDRSQPKRGWFG